MTVPPTTPRASKRALRKRVLAARDALGPAEREARSAALRERVLSLPLWKRARTVHLFAPFGSEVDTVPLIRALLAEKRRALLPRVAPGRVLEHCLVESEEDLAPGAYAIPEPGRHCVEVEPDEVDLVLVPGVAFDRSGGRLGYGGGFYDAFLGACPAPRVALAFALQIVPVVPREGHDLLVHALVTDEELVIVAPDRVEPPPVLGAPGQAGRPESPSPADP